MATTASRIKKYEIVCMGGFGDYRYYLVHNGRTMKRIPAWIGRLFKGGVKYGY